MRINYLAELIFPSKKAYAIHVMKMCNALSKKNNVRLFVFRNKKNNIFFTYNCFNKFKIIDMGLNKINFYNRIIYSFSLLNEIKSKNEIIISRSIIGALLLSFKGYNVILEIRHELKSATNFFFNLSKYFDFFKKIKFIFVSKNLLKKFKLDNKQIILDDAVDISDFNRKKKSNRIKKTCCYTGSLAKGKGLEKIFEISKKLKNIDFHIYGDFLNSNYSVKDFNEYENVKYKGYLSYNKIPKVLEKYDVLLMPYAEKVYGRGSNLEIGKYMSPLKLFDYLAAGKIIIATDLKVYDHILNKNNAILIKDSKVDEWVKKINFVFKNLKKFDYLKKNSKITIKKHTWDIRVKKVINFINV